MLKKAMIYVEGKSEDELFSGKSFKEFFESHGFIARIRSLNGKGNILKNYEKFIKIQSSDYKLTVLLYDRDSNLDASSVQIQSNKTKIFHEAIQEIEAWYLADHEEMKNIDSTYKTVHDTQSITNPKDKLISIFQKAKKGFKTEISLANHFKDKINLEIAQKNNKSLEKFLKLFT